MLRLNEILDALKLARAVGQVPFGHFDHDADCAIGPRTVPVKEQDQVGAETKESREEAPAVVRYERFEDPRTGEPLYRPVRIE